MSASWLTHICVSLPADPYMCHPTADPYICQKIGPNMISKKSKKSQNGLKWSGNGPFGLKLGGNGAEINHKHFGNSPIPIISHIWLENAIWGPYGPKWGPKGSAAWPKAFNKRLAQRIIVSLEHSTRSAPCSKGFAWRSRAHLPLDR